MLPVFAATSLLSPTTAISVSALFAGILTAYNSKEISASDYLYDSFFDDPVPPVLKDKYAEKEQVYLEYSAERVNAMQSDVNGAISVLPQINNVQKNLVESSTINSGLVNTIVTASNKSAEISKELSNNLTYLNNTLVHILEAKNKELINQDVLRADISDSLKSVVLALSSLSSIPKILAESQSKSLGLQYDIHGALNYTAEQASASVSNLSAIKDILDTKTNDQIETNTKVQEHYDYQKTKSINASDGTAYSPREVSAKSNAEHYLDKKGHNTFDWATGFIDSVSDIDLADEDNVLKNLFELLKTTPLELIDQIDNSKVLIKKEV